LPFYFQLFAFLIFPFFILPFAFLSRRSNILLAVLCVGGLPFVFNLLSLVFLLFLTHEMPLFYFISLGYFLLFAFYFLLFTFYFLLLPSCCSLRRWITFLLLAFCF